MGILSWLRERRAPRIELGRRAHGAPEHGGHRPDVVAPLTGDRVRRWLLRAEYGYFTDVDGDIGGLWRGRLFYFFTLGERHEILQIRGQWNRTFAIERLAEVLEITNDWNSERVWPKAYLRVRDDGRVHALCESATDLEHGANEAQLGQLLHSGIASAAAFFDVLDELYPDPAGIAP